MAGKVFKFYIIPQKPQYFIFNWKILFMIRNDILKQWNIFFLNTNIYQWTYTSYFTYKRPLEISRDFVWNQIFLKMAARSKLHNPIKEARGNFVFHNINYHNVNRTWQKLIVLTVMVVWLFQWLMESLGMVLIHISHSTLNFRLYTHKIVIFITKFYFHFESIK